jgi:hypothetical protein
MRVGYYLSWFYWHGITIAALDEQNAAGRRSGIPRWVVRRMAGALAGGAAAAVTLRVPRLVEHAIDAAYLCGYTARAARLTAAARPAAAALARHAA